MRTSIVPAQITDAEDKIGRLSMQQAGLLVIPIVLSFAITTILPPSGFFVSYKAPLMIALFVIFGTLALRIKGMIVGKWLILLAMYIVRPQYYVYDKDTTYLRVSEEYKTPEMSKPTKARREKTTLANAPEIAHREFVRLEQLARDSRSNLQFKVGKKGELNVRITEID